MPETSRTPDASPDRPGEAQRFEIVTLSSEGEADLEQLSSAPILAFHTEGSLPPIFILRSWSREGLSVRSLARLLGPDQPVYSIAPPQHESADLYPSTTGEWCDHMEPRLRAIPHEGPYVLGGWSFGGVIALELGERLVAAGEGVELILFLDSRLPREIPKRAPNAKPPVRLERFGRQVLEFSELQSRADRIAYLRYRWSPRRGLAKLLGEGRYSADSLEAVAAGDSPTLARVKERAQRRKAREARKRSRKQEKAPLPEGQIVTTSRGEQMSFLQRSIHRSYLKYTKRPSHLPVAQFWTRESFDASNGDATLGWAPYLRGDYRGEPSEGSHWTMFEEPHVHKLASRVSSVLRQVREDGRVYRADSVDSAVLD